MSSIALVFVVNVVSSAFKRWVYPKWGKFGVQAVVFAIALVAALGITYADQFPSIKELTLTAVAIFSLSVSLYEVLLSRFDIFKQPEVVREG